MSTNANLTPSNENAAEQAITIQPLGIAAFPGSVDWMAAGGEPGQNSGSGGLAVLHALRRHWLVIVSTGLACAAVAGGSMYALLKKHYTAEAILKLEPSQPSFTGISKADQAAQVMNEFEIFRDTQQQLIKSRFVIGAALRDANLKNRPCIAEQDAKHNAVAWLTEEIHADFQSKNAGIMRVSATELDPHDAAAIVNAVVNAYLNEVVGVDQQVAAERLRDLTAIAAEKEQEVRKRREELTQELKNVGGGDEQTMAQRAAMKMSVYAQFNAELEGMRSQYRVLLGKQSVAIETKKTLPSAQIPEAEIVMLLNSDPVYRDLKSRVAVMKQIERFHVNATPDGLKQPNVARSQQEFAAATAQLEELKETVRGQIREARGIELDRDMQRLKIEAEILSEQINGFENRF